MKEEWSFDHIAKKSSVYKTPEGYFEALDESIMQKIQSEHKSPKIFRIKSVQYLLAVAAVGILLLGTFLWLNKQNDKVIDSIQWADNQLIEQYIETNLDLFDESLLLEYSDNAMQVDWIDETVTDESLIDLLLDEVSIEELEALTL